jgi:putative membrane protein PagO
MNGEKARIWGGFLIVSLVWGSTWLVIKLGIQTIPPFFAAGVRFCIAAAVLFAIVRARRLAVPLTRDARVLFVTMAVLSFGIPFALVYWAEQHIPTGLASVLFAAFPFWVAIFSQVFLKSEPIDAFKAAGIVLGFGGILLIFWGDFDISNPLAAWAMAAVITSTIMQAMMLIVVKKLGQEISPFVMNFAGMSMAGPFLLLMSFAVEPWTGMRWDATAVGSILYLALAGSILTFVSYYWLLKRIKAVYLSLTSFINPIVAVILGAIVLGETLDTSFALGASCVLAGILVANGRTLYARITSK